MRVGIWSNAAHVTSGYGLQAGQLARHLAADGHDPAVYAFAGLSGAVMNIGGIPHYPSGRMASGADVIPGHVARHRPDVVIALADLMRLDTGVVRWLQGNGVPVWAWFPVDCEPLSVIDRAWLDATGARPVAMSRFGHGQLEAAGFAPAYVPHSVDTRVFAPPDPAAREQARRDLGYDGRFVVAINAANKESERKGWYEAFAGFARFHAKQKNSLLVLHTELAPDIPLAGEGVAFDHAEYARLLGIEDAVTGADQLGDYAYKTGMIDARAMAGWYGVADVYLCASLAEGFGIPLVEAAACGVPLIGNTCSAVTELVKGSGGWLVPSQPRSNPIHKRQWRTPSIPGITAALGKAYAAWAGPAYAQRRKRAREWALGYDADLVYDRDWRPLLKEREAEIADG